MKEQLQQLGEMLLSNNLIPDLGDSSSSLNNVTQNFNDMKVCCSLDNVQEISKFKLIWF